MHGQPHIRFTISAVHGTVTWAFDKPTQKELVSAYALRRMVFDPRHFASREIAVTLLNLKNFPQNVCA